MGHWVARHVRAKFQSEDDAAACALRLEAFLPVYIEALRSSEGPLGAALQDTLRRDFGFVAGTDLYWGKDGAMFEDPTLVSRLGSEVVVYFDGCHYRDDLREFFAPTFELAGATAVDGGAGTHVSIYYEIAFPSDDALRSYNTSGAGWAQAADPNRTKIQGIHAQAILDRLSAFFEGRSNIDSGGEYVCCFGPGRGAFEELVNFEHLLCWTDGVYGGIYMPFDGDIERLQKFFSNPAFRRSRIRWCTDTPFAELRALGELAPCASCGGRLFPTWPEVEDAFGAVECVTCGLRPSLATLDSCGEPESKFSVALRGLGQLQSLPPTASKEEKLLRSITDGDEVKVRELLAEGVDPNCSTSDGTPLLACAGTGSAQLVKLLVEAGADPNLGWSGYESGDPMDPLDYAALDGDTAVVRALVNAGANKDSATNALPGSVMYGDLEMVTALFAAGAKAKAQDGTNAFHTACVFGKVDIVEFLIDRGACPNSTDSAGKTPLLLLLNGAPGWAIQGALGKPVDGLGGLPAMLTAVVEAAVKIGQTMPPNERLVRLVVKLIEAGANPNAMDSDGRGAIEYALAGNMGADLIGLLFRLGCEQEISPDAKSRVRELLAGHPSDEVRALFGSSLSSDLR